VRRGLVGIKPTQARPNGAGYARLNLLATAGIYIVQILSYMLNQNGIKIYMFTSTMFLSVMISPLKNLGPVNVSDSNIIQR
jgi:hypothetical protein